MTRADRPEVIVAGSGPAGALAARLLADAGVRVLVIEAGRDPPGAPRTTSPVEFSLGEEEEARWSWSSEGMSAAWVRARLPGGRSRMWGGWFSPCPAGSFEHDAAMGSPWPFDADTMLRLQRAVADTLRALGASVPTEEEGARCVDGADEAIRATLSRELGVVVAPRSAMTVAGRPLHALDLLDGIPMRSGLVAMHLALQGGEEVTGLVVRDADGVLSSIPCAEVLLATSPIETARVLFETARVERAQLHRRVGRGLVDHLVVGSLIVAPHDRPPARASGEALWIPRFVNTSTHPRDYPGGFSVEVSRTVGLDLLPPALRAALPPGFDAAGGGTPGVWAVHALGEMFPREGRDVGFDAARRDALGRAVPHARLFLDEAERRMIDDMEETCEVVATALGGRDAVVIPTLSPRDTYLIGHEAGTCAMGAGPDHVVDLRGRVRGLKGARVADGSLMPTATDRHPTAALLALTLSVTTSLIEDLRGA